jgi:hypothetical protein
MPRKRQRNGHVGQGPGDNKGTFWQEDLDDLDAFLLALGFLLQRGSSYCLTRGNP